VNGVAFNTVVAFTGISALVGKTEIVIARTVICAVFDTRVLKTEVAVMVTVKSLGGGVLGAV
jgi:hypothetical protein